MFRTWTIRATLNPHTLNPKHPCPRPSILNLKASAPHPSPNLINALHNARNSRAASLPCHPPRRGDGLGLRVEEKAWATVICSRRLETMHLCYLFNFPGESKDVARLGLKLPTSGHLNLAWHFVRMPSASYMYS